MLAASIFHRREIAIADLKAGMDAADVVFIAVGTPPDEDGSADLQYVLAVAQSIAEHMQGFKIVVDKSTVPVGRLGLKYWPLH